MSDWWEINDIGEARRIIQVMSYDLRLAKAGRDILIAVIFILAAAALLLATYSMSRECQLRGENPAASDGLA